MVEFKTKKNNGPGYLLILGALGGVAVYGFGLWTQLLVWNWFIAPIFNAPVLGWMQMMGLAVAVQTLLIWQSARHFEKSAKELMEKEDWGLYSKGLLLSFYYAMAYGGAALIAWVIHHFM